MIIQTEPRRTLYDWMLYGGNPFATLFSSEATPVYSTLISAIRDVIDVKDNDAYTTKAVDNCMIEMYGNLEMRSLFNKATIPIPHLVRTLEAVIGKNAYEYTALLNTINESLEINPFEMNNYTKTLEKEYGQHITDKDFGQKQLTDVKGPTTLTDNMAARTDTTSEYATTMDNTTAGSEKLKNKTVEALGQHTDTHSTVQVTDTHTHTASKDTITSKTHTDTFTETFVGNKDNDEIKLIMEYREMAKFSLVQRIAHDLAFALCVKTYQFDYTR